MKNWEKAALIVIVAALLLRLVLFNVNYSFSQDEAAYLGLAEGLSSGNGYGYIGNQMSDGFRPPLLPFLISIIFAVVGVNYTVVQFVFALVSIVSICVSVWVIYKLFGKEVALLSGLFLATNPLHFLFSMRVMSETLSMMFVTLGFYYFLKFLENTRYSIHFGILLGLSILLHSSLVLLLPIYAIMYIFHTFYPSKKMKELLLLIKNKYFWLGLIAFLLVLSPWLYYQTIDYGSPVGGLLTHASGSGFRIPVEFMLIGLLASGPMIIFFGKEMWRFKSRPHDKTLNLTLLFLGLFLAIGGLVLASVRYALPILPLLAVFIAKGVEERWKNIYILFAVLMLATALIATYQYAHPFLPIEQLPTFLSSYTPSYFDANNARKDAALLVENSTSPNEIIITGAPQWLWVYTHRNWEPLPDDEQEFWNTIDSSGAHYIYTEPTKPYLENNTGLEAVIKNRYVEVYKIIGA